MSAKPNLKTQRQKIRRRLPHWAATALKWFSRASPWLRWPAAIALVIARIFGFLPIAGFWMVPLGLLLVVQDIPALRPPLAKLLAYIDSKWPA